MVTGINDISGSQNDNMHSKFIHKDEMPTYRHLIHISNYFSSLFIVLLIISLNFIDVNVCRYQYLTKMYIFSKSQTKSLDIIGIHL